MYTLLTGIYKQLMERKEYGVLLVGLEGAGKTTLLERMKTLFGGGGLAPDKVVSTVGCNVARLDTSGRCKLLLWDLGGRSALRSIWEKYYADSKAVIYCVDCADPVHWEESKCVLMEVMKGCPNVPVLVVCCKSDVPGSKHKDSVAAFFGFAAQEKMIMFVAASAITADDKKGIIDGLAWLEKKLHEP